MSSESVSSVSKPLTEDAIKACLSPYLCWVWDAASVAVNDPTDANMAAFKQLCRPGEVMVLLREYAQRCDDYARGAVSGPPSA